MSDVIQFLEAMGRNPARSTADYAAAVVGLDLDDTQREALLNRDHYALGKLLGGRGNARCVLLTPETSEFRCVLLVPEVEEFRCVLLVPEELN